MRLAAQPFIRAVQASLSETSIWGAMHVNVKVTNAQAIIKALEETNQFTIPWTLNLAERQEAIILQGEWEYHHLLDELEFCVVLCQFEIEKLGLQKTGTPTSSSSFIS